MTKSQHGIWPWIEMFGIIITIPIIIPLVAVSEHVYIYIKTKGTMILSN